MVILILGRNGYLTDLVGKYGKQLLGYIMIT